MARPYRSRFNHFQLLPLIGNIRYGTVVEQFIQVVPELLPLYEKQIQSFGEIINYAFFGSLVYFMVEHLKQMQSDSPEQNQSRDILHRIITFIERCCLSDNKDVVTLMATGFMETLYVAGEDELALVALLDPKSKELYDRMA